MMGLIRAEVIKILKRRTFWVLVVVLATLTGLLALLFFILPRFAPPEAGLPAFPKPEVYLIGAQQVLGQTWFPLILAVMLLAGELATSTWATALTRNARRYQHLLARLFTTTTASWLAMLAAIVGFGLAALFLGEGSGFVSGADLAGLLWKSLLVVFTWVSLGLAASAWLRSVGPAIGAVLAFSFGDGLLSLWSGWRRVSLSSHTSALLGDLDQLGGLRSILGETPSFAKALTVVLTWAVVAVVAAWAGLQLRDA